MCRCRGESQDWVITCDRLLKSPWSDRCTLIATLARPFPCHFARGTSKESGRWLSLPAGLWICLDVCWNLLNWLIIVLQVAILEENKIVVLVGLDAVFAEGVCALVTRSFYFFALVARLLAIWYAVVSWRLPQHRIWGADSRRHPLFNVSNLLVSTHLLSRQINNVIYKKQSTT